MAKKYSCKNCGAELYFDPKSGKLHCDYCGSDYDPSEYDWKPDEGATDQTIPQAGAEGAAGAADAGDAKATDDSVSTDDLVVYKCPNCGAEVITSKKTVATTCVYCNRAITLEGNVQGDFRPDYVLPFERERSEVVAAYQKLCKKSILTPRLFTRESQTAKIKGMYVPYWLFSFEGRAMLNVRAENIRTFVRGDEEITEVSRYMIDEEGKASFERVPTDAMKEMDNAMMDSIEPFDFSKLKPFNPAYLAGFYTQRWDDDQSANEPRAKARAKEQLSAEVMSHVGPYGTKVIQSEQYQWSDQKVEQVMIPVWMMYTEYKGKKYVFGMNGQTGKMMGEIPKDPMRILKIALGTFLGTQVLFMLIRLLEVLL